MKRFFWLCFGLFLISRLFIADYPHFYDSPEYLRLSLESNLFTALSKSHESIHPLYLYLAQFFQKIFSYFLTDLHVWSVSLVSVIFGALGVISFYLLVKRLFNKRIALLSFFPLIFFPHLWLIQTNILHETVEQGLFLFGLLVFDLFLEKRKLWFLFLAGLSWGLAIFNFAGIILWFPLILVVFFLHPQKEKQKQNLLMLGFALFLACCLGFGGLYFVLEQFDLEPLLRLRHLLFGYGGGGIFSNWKGLDILRLLRNDLFILFYGYSPAAIIAIFYLMIFLLRQKDYKKLIVLGLSLMPFLISGKFWYGGLFGRYSALVAYPLSLSLALIPKTKIYFLLMIVLIAFYIPVFWAYQQKPIPEIQASLIDEVNLKEGDLLVLSDYQRPQLEGRYQNTFYLNGNRETQKEIEGLIQENLNKGNRVFISSQAINFPFYQYDGQQIHIISKGDISKAILTDFLVDKKLSLMEIDLKYPELSLYKLEK